MKRAEFSKDTKRQALRRSGGFCEAIGAVYGFSPGHRCNAPLSFGVEFDHYPIRAADGGSAELSNCVAVCIKCHRWKTARFDVPAIAKRKRLIDRQWGLTRSSHSFSTNRKGPFKKKLNGQVILR